MMNSRVFQIYLFLSVTCVFLTALHTSPALALCAAPQEAGTWINTNRSENPYSIEIKLIDCGDQVLNGVQRKTRYGITVSVKQSSGALYHRPQVEAQYRAAGGKQWLVAKVPTGGYVDSIWMRTISKDGKQRLYTHIRHKSLDSKPDATSKFWFIKK